MTEVAEELVVEEPKAGARPRLKFEPAGTQRKLKRIFTVKAFSPDGTLVQLPVADQINNNVAGSDQLIGLRHYVRKGYDVLWDFDKGVGAYCPMGDCYAKWNDAFRGYCSPGHLESADMAEIRSTLAQNVTTSVNKWTRS